jgi:tetratricopeptide (TPR) repeat protein
MRRNFAVLILIPIWLIAAGTPAQGSPVEQWVEARSSHFVVLTNSNEKDAVRVASQFERMRMVFRTLLPTSDDDSSAPIMVLAVKDRKSLQTLEPEAYLAKNQMDLAGFFLRSADKNYILLRLDAQQGHAYSTVYHEYTHYMLRKADNWLPLWLNEGLAQFYENTDMDDKTAWLGEANADELQYLKRNDLLPIETLLAVDAKSPYYHDEEKGSMFYAESWALTHYLIVSDRVQGTHRVHDYAELLAEGVDSVTAALTVFGDLSKLQNGLSEYVMQRKFMYFMMPAQPAAKDATLEVRAVSSLEADAVRADFMLYTGRVQDARALAERVLRDAPENALAQETMGLLSYREGDFAGARSWFDAALALDSKSYLANYYSAMLALRSGDKDDDGRIEAGLNAAIRLNPEFAPAYDTLAMLYASRHRRLDEAHALNLRAVALEPGRLGYRLNCAEVLSQQRQFAEALGELQEAMRLAKTSLEIEAVANRVARVERYQTAMTTASVQVGGEIVSGQ